MTEINPIALEMIRAAAFLAPDAHTSSLTDKLAALRLVVSANHIDRNIKRTPEFLTFILACANLVLGSGEDSRIASNVIDETGALVRGHRA